jgi:protein-disulfide isomerase
MTNKSRVVLATIFAGCIAGPIANAWAQGITSQQAEAILEELKQIHQLLLRQQAAPAPAAVQAQLDDKVSLVLEPGGYSIGRSDAPLTMVEYTDFQCPFCRQFHMVTFDSIKKNYIDTGKLRYISRDFPLDMHENARRAALAGRCAGEQGQFWEMRHVMIVNANQLKPDNIVGYARDLNLDVDRFRSCLDSGKYRADIDRNLAEGQAVGVTGTPSFVLGRTGVDKVDGVRLVGAKPYAVFDAKLKEMLAATATP